VGSSKKRHRFPLEDNEEFISEAEDTRTQAATTITTTTDTSNSQISTFTVTQQSSSQSIQRNRRPFSEVWDYFVKGTEKNNGHYEATCSYCGKIWAQGKPTQLEAHLANECA
ncbi:11481_t:CDS:1, partial [Racocetra fulgida]